MDRPEGFVDLENLRGEAGQGGGGEGCHRGDERNFDFVWSGIGEGRVIVDSGE